MVLSIARQSVILKCLRQKSVLLGNYEFYYLAGVMEHIYKLGLTKELAPKELFEEIQKHLKELAPANDEEKYLLKLVEFYEPLAEYDEQMKQLFEWGKNEKDLWSVQTSYSPQ